MTDYFGEVEKTSFMVGYELWEENFEPLLEGILIYVYTYVQIEVVR